MSDLGVIALIGHLPSYWSGYTKIYSTSKKKDKDGKDKDKKKKEEEEQSKGMGRFAATVREARDGFSSGVPEDMSRAWNLELDLNIGVAEFVFGFDSVGGSEIRHNENTYVWSAADTLVGGAKLRIIKWWFPMELPFGSGGAQAVDKESDILKFIPPSFPTSFYGARDPDVYAGAGDVNHLTAWPGTVAEMEENAEQGYKGLQPYRDMAEMDEKEPGKFSLPFKAPFFMVGVTKPLSKLHDIKGDFDISSQPDKHTLTANKEWKDFDRMGAVAKSELYFSRPTDLSYFSRNDGLKEKPNVFSPFWQARLVDTSNFDRFLSLALQQKIIWLREDDKSMIGGGTADRILSLIDDVLNAVTSVFNALLKLIL